jgi:predicted alpha/beta hydrolase family esterase
MASKAYQPAAAHDPLILIVPESPDSAPQHWQTRWLQRRDNCRRLDLGMWDQPHRNTWVNKLNLAIYRAERPVLLVGHGLGCLTIAWWAEYERPSADGAVIGALLIAPPDPDLADADSRVARFGAAPRQPLPFPAFVVASADDPGCSLSSAIDLARDWDCRFTEAGAVGHLDAASGVGDWALGQRLLDRMLREHGPAPTASDHGRSVVRPVSGPGQPRLRQLER